ncbi:hypothetical protein SAMN04487772_106119 [[Clostridium] polysaccharolyticum]|uniref:Uncharacterized protein n=1 Tax=[Clostridium] polysaccharolyticum TaxID=29364 RepID=A0A1I0B1Z6_9FIRM|nr:hypothetical protein SAMN04487772_106119 [[Clostridium] polysaccharolyticum]
MESTYCGKFNKIRSFGTWEYDLFDIIMNEKKLVMDVSFLLGLEVIRGFFSFLISIS